MTSAPRSITTATLPARLKESTPLTPAEIEDVSNIADNARGVEVAALRQQLTGYLDGLNRRLLEISGVGASPEIAEGILSTNSAINDILEITLNGKPVPLASINTTTPSTPTGQDTQNTTLDFPLYSGIPALNQIVRQTPPEERVTLADGKVLPKSIADKIPNIAEYKVNKVIDVDNKITITLQKGNALAIQLVVQYKYVRKQIKVETVQKVN